LNGLNRRKITVSQKRLKFPLDKYKMMRYNLRLWLGVYILDRYLDMAVVASYW